MKKYVILLAVMLLVLLPATVATAQTETTGVQVAPATVTVVHGIPDLAVDIWANGDPLLENFTFETVTDALMLPDGDYDLEIYAAGTDPAGNMPALAATVTLVPGANATIVAHFDADGAPTLTVFQNDISPIDAGQGRVTARHVAAAPTVDILANDGVLFGDVSNPQEGVADVPAATYDVKIVPAGATDPVVFQTDLAIPEGTNVIVYAIGDLAGGSFTVAAQTIANLHSPPEGVPTGTGGLAGSVVPTWLIGGMSLGLLSLIGASTLAARRSR